jgi:hypothetical protein
MALRPRLDEVLVVADDAKDDAEPEPEADEADDDDDDEPAGLLARIVEIGETPPTGDFADGEISGSFALAVVRTKQQAMRAIRVRMNIQNVELHTGLRMHYGKT